MALKYYYDEKNHEKPHFIGKSKGILFTDDLKLEHPKRNYGRHIPWNYGLQYENQHELYLNTDKKSSMQVPTGYIINLKNRYDRMAELQLHLNCRIIKFETFSAIRFKPGYIGCARSHINLLKMAKKMNLPYLLVLEDDVMPVCANFERRLLQVIRWLCNNYGEWDVFNSLPLGYNFEEIDQILDKDLGIVRVIGGLNTQLIIYNSSVYDRLIALEQEYYNGMYDGDKKFVLPWDCVLTRVCQKMVTCIPFLTSAFSIDSDINTRGDVVPAMKNFHDVCNWELNNYPLFAGGFSDSSDVTVVVTGYNRYAELTRTLNSFVKYNSYPVKQIIISEESYDDIHGKFAERYPDYRMIKGQGSHMESLDALYKEIDTEYFFHLEDDWVCVRPWFIEQSKRIMDADPKVICVWLRDLNDTNLHPIGEYAYIGNMHCFKMTFNYSGQWHGYTLNPTLRRSRDIIEHAQYKDSSSLPEACISQYYYDQGFYAVILPVAHFYHIGRQSTYHKSFKKLTALSLNK